MLIQPIKYLLLFIVICSCTHKDNTIHGQYKSRKFSLWERIEHPFHGRSKGMKLDLRKDFVFRHETCGDISTGTWRIKNDSLILTSLNRFSRIDSISLKTIRFAYIIESNGELHRVFGNQRKVLDYLIKVEENKK